MNEFDPRHKDYGVILAEQHPEVEFSSNKLNQTFDTYLWYPYELGKHPVDFVGYHKEKLAITDPTEALHLIDQWNQDIEDNTLEPVMFSKVIRIADTKFGVIDLPDSNNSIVMMNRAGKFPYQKTIHAGRGGYGWQYLQPGIKPTHQALKDKFNLNKAQANQFIKSW